MAEKSRTIGVAMDFSKGSKAALKWATEGFFRKGDTLYVIHVKPQTALESRNLLWYETGSPLIPFHEFYNEEVMHGYGLKPDPEVLDLLKIISTQLEVTVVGKVYWGDAREKVCEAVGELKLDSVVMGSRGLSSLQRVLMGSVTSYVLEHAPCAVTVVKDTHN